MARTLADALIETLIDWDVKVVFGLPGDGINGIMEALRTHQDKVQFVQVRHEESAAFMACAYSKYTGRLGVCLATSGPGGIHLLNGLYDAKLDGVPVLAITGHHQHDLIDTHAQQDVDLDKLFMDVSVYNCRVMGPAHIERVTNLACRSALTLRGVAHLNIPTDFQGMPMKEGHPSERNIPMFKAAPFFRPSPLPHPDGLKAAADLLNGGKRVAMLVGQGALGAREEVLQVAELLGAPIIKALLGKAVVPDEHPLTTGSIGLLGTSASVEAMKDCDTLLTVGSSFPYIEFMPDKGQARCVQIDIDPVRLSLRYPAEVGIVADSKEALKALIPLLRRKEDRAYLEGVRKTMGQWRKLMEERGTREDIPIKPQRVAWELGKRLADDAIVTSDSGTIATWFARQIMARGEQKFSLSGTLATMAPGLPYTLAAQYAYPGRQCVALVGDGGISMLMADISTAVRYKLPVKIVVVSNGTLGQIKWEQMVFDGAPEFGCDLQPIDYAKVAEACGARGYHVEDPAKLGAAFDAALAWDGPVVVDCVVDPYEPPLPGKISFEQARKFAGALLKGEKDRGKIIGTLLEDMVKN
jgi:pyruvate dehydrogenase (quinone)/pyruvate oxidase